MMQHARVTGVLEIVYHRPTDYPQLRQVPLPSNYVRRSDYQA